VIGLLVAAGAVVALGAGVAVGAQRARTATLGALVALVFTPFVADPLPDPLVIAFGIVAGVLAAFLLLIAARRAGVGSSSPLGLPATLVAAAAAFAFGLGATAVRLPDFGPSAALGAGVAALAVGVGVVVLARDAFRLGTAAVVVLDAGLLLRSGLAGTAPPLETLFGGLLLVAFAATTAILAGAAATATGDLAIRDRAGSGASRRIGRLRRP
jgi:hypothetical protein